jgi:hypothetical protein
MALGGNKEYHNRIVAMSLGEMGPLAFVKDKVCAIVVFSVSLNQNTNLCF